MKCPKCQTDNPDNKRYCRECATRLVLTCPQCGAEVLPNDKFCGDCAQDLRKTQEVTRIDYSQPQSYTPKHLADKILQSKSALEGERKQVTVLFADVKGSMDLAEQVDPEEWHRILDRFFQILTEGVHRYEGTVNQYTGDGIMALFGAPIAHEDHAQRACYTALRLSDELQRYAGELKREKGLLFSVRMGLNSGEVVVGKIGDDLRMDYTAQGQTVGLAARMEQLAEQGKAYLTEHTAKMVEGFCRLCDLGRFNVKGVQEPLRVYELQGVGPLRTRLEVAARHGLVRFVGRHREIGDLQRAWEAAEAGRGQIVAVLGEAGVGKSRLLYEFKRPLGSGFRVLEAFSVSHGKAYAYLPLLELLKGYFRITIEDDEGRRQEKVTGTVLTLDRTLEDTLPYLFSLLGIGDQTSWLEQMNPEIRRQRTLEAVKRVLVRETLRQPCVLIFEDLHWIDTETQAFLDLLIESVATARLLLLVNYRPEYQHGWGSKTYYTQLRLDPFGPEEAEELLGILLGKEASRERKALDRLILEKTQGNPFFMQELVQTLVEEGVLVGEQGRYRLQRSPTELHIPATVQGVLAARIDRLPSQEKDLLQTLAVIGKEFSLGLIRAVAGESEEDLFRGLSHLQAAEFIYERPAFPDPEYVFKHALTQEVAYQSLLGERRRVLHERVGQAIEALYPNTLDSYYEELAHHYGRSVNTAKAVEYLHLAGEQAVQRSAYLQGIEKLGRAVDLLAALPETREHRERELLVQLAMGKALGATQGLVFVEVEQAYARARVLCGEVGQPAQRFSALGGLCVVHYFRGETDKAMHLAEQLFDLARETHHSPHLHAAHRLMGQVFLGRGDFCTARHHEEEALRLYEPGQYGEREYYPSFVHGQVPALGFLSWALSNLGFPEQALTRCREAVALARELSHPFSEASALLYAAYVHSQLREWKSSQEVADAVIALANEHGFLEFIAIGTFLRVDAVIELGELDLHEGIAVMRTVIDAVRAKGAVPFSQLLLPRMAERYKEAGQVEEGLALVSEALEVIGNTGFRYAEAETNRVKGELILARSSSDHEEAEACFRRVLEVARSQSAKLYELRAAMSLARLWQQQGRKDEARDLLAPVYDWFTEGFDIRDLKEAKAILDELA